MATFGMTVDGSVPDNGWQGYQAASPFAAPEDGTITAMEMWVHPQTNDQTMVLAVWAESAGSPGALLAQTSPIVAAITGGIQQISGSLVSSLAITNGTSYWLGFCDTTSSAVLGLQTSANGTGSYAYKAATSPSDPFGTPGGTNDNNFPVAAIYTPAAGVGTVSRLLLMGVG